MPATGKDLSLTVSCDLDRARLDAVVRNATSNSPWSRVRAWIQSGKVAVDNAPCVDPALRVRAGQRVELRMNAPKPTSARRLTDESIAFVDQHLVVVRKPPGINSIPFDKGERGTLQELVRAWLNRTAPKRHEDLTGDVGVVHRIDKETSGLLVFSRTLTAKRSLDEQFRKHTVERAYFAIAHGRVERNTIRSRLVADRGDGLRGSTSDPKKGRPAVTRVEPLAHLAAATLIRCRLETGRTHQIRVHLSEAGHPLLGERVYVRDYPDRLLPAPRMMLHAALLGFEHPTKNKHLQFEMNMPDDMQKVVDSLRRTP